MKIFYYLNGKFVEKNQARIKVNDLGLLRGYGVFDYLRTYNCRPFYLEDHLQRFFRSAAGLNLKVPVSQKKLRQIIFQLLAKNKSLKEMNFRIVLTGGETEDAKTSKKPTFFIMVGRPHFYPPKVYNQGVKILSLNYGREWPEIKTTNYLLAVSHWPEVLKKKASEIIYVNQGKVLEAATSNFFTVKNKIILTPQSGILGGVTRKIIIQLARQNKIPLREKNLSWKEILRADECFLTATDKEVLPVVQIDHHQIGSGQPGPVTKKLISLFGELVKNY